MCRGVVDDAQHLAGFWVALDLCLDDCSSANGLSRRNVQYVGGTSGGCIGAGTGGVIDAEELERLFLAAGNMIETGCEAESAVILCESFFRIPRGIGLVQSQRAGSSWDTSGRR